jgi:hypothetical protein
MCLFYEDLDWTLSQALNLDRRHFCNQCWVTYKVNDATKGVKQALPLSSSTSVPLYLLLCIPHALLGVPYMAPFDPQNFSGKRRKKCQSSTSDITLSAGSFQLHRIIKAMGQQSKSREACCSPTSPKPAGFPLFLFLMHMPNVLFRPSLHAQPSLSCNVHSIDFPDGRKLYASQVSHSIAPSSIGFPYHCASARQFKVNESWGSCK